MIELSESTLVAKSKILARGSGARLFKRMTGDAFAARRGDCDETKVIAKGGSVVDTVRHSGAEDEMEEGEKQRSGNADSTDHRKSSRVHSQAQRPSSF